MRIRSGGFRYAVVYLKVMGRFEWGLWWSSRCRNRLWKQLRHPPTRDKAKRSKKKRCLPGRTEGLRGLAVLSALIAFF